MAGGSLPGIVAPPKRGKGRPKGALNKRAKDFQGFIAAKYGGSAAQQMAAVCMVTPAEVKAAGSVFGARVRKAEQLVAMVREADQGRDGQLRQVLREELESLAAEMAEADAKALRRLVNGFLGRVREAASGFTVRDALKLMDDQQAALLPYTDKRQPLAIEAEGDGFRPHVVVLGGTGQAVGEAMAALPESDTEIIGEFVDVTPQVSRPKSHDEQQSLALQGFELPGPTD